MPSHAAFPKTHGSFEAQHVHAQTIDECLDYPADMIGWYKVVQNRWKQRSLAATLTLDVSHKEDAPHPRSNLLIFSSGNHL
jgi:hypothetical protein